MPLVLEQQVTRLLADPRSAPSSPTSPEQWLHLRNLKSSAPDLEAFPDFDDNLRQAMKEETSLFFDSIVREDHSIRRSAERRLHVRQRAAGAALQHAQRLRQPVPAREGRQRSAPRAARPRQPADRTSYPNRTSPVERGKWVLTNLLGVPPQPPPPNVPPLEENLGRRQGALVARAHGKTPRQPDLRGLSQGDGSDRLRARELRRHRRAGADRGGRADRYVRHALQRHRSRRRRRAAPAASSPSRTSSSA